MKSKKPFDIKRFLIPILRRKSVYSPERNRCLQLARRERGFYECKSCNKLFGRKEVHVDHIQSVVSVRDAWIDWNTYIARLFVSAEEMQVLCVNCHSSKTLLENELRSINKKAKNKKKKVK